MSRPKNTPEQQEAYRLRQLEQQRQRRELRRIKVGAGRPQMTPEQKDAARLRKKEYDKRRRPSKRQYIQSIHGGRVHVFYVPPHVLEERARRQSAPETLNTKYLGDPVTPRWMSNADREVKHPNFGMGIIRGC